MAPSMTNRVGRTVQVVPLLGVRRLGHRRFDYLVPPDLDGQVQPGSVVRAPFGHRSVRAVVVGEEEAAEGDVASLRWLESVADDRIPEDLLRLTTSLSTRYLATYESCLRLVAPPGAADTASRTRRTGRIAWVEPAAEVSLMAETIAAVRLTAKQRALLDAVPAGGRPIAGLCESAGVGRSVLRALIDKGLLRISEAPLPEGNDGEVEQKFARVPMPTLWPEQQRVVSDLLDAYDTPGLAHRLLWGVTGSGKTEVYLRLIEHARRRGEGAILLVPEIALTPQMIDRVRGRFGCQVGVLHSGLTKATRMGEYRRIAAGLAPVVVGARSAVLAPVPRLRLIIIDEAHDASYKHEEEPRYHASTVARMRLSDGGGLLVEGTATPSVESMRLAGDRLRLSQRAAGVEPTCEIVDMRRQGAGLLLAPYSREALAETLRKDEQAIVLLNRRGFAGYVHCELCGHVMTCRECDLSLTYHSHSRRLLCHHCGRAYEEPARCPACQAGPLTRGSPGTERLDRELRSMVPRQQVFRMDSDALGGGKKVQSILRDFAAARPAVLVGTQMVAKGHDFPDVTLVLVADADTGLYVPDFRAAERTFQLLRQVAGRAGRSDRPGRVVVQTWNPDVPCIRMALERDEEKFYREELRIRERLGYPPFSEIVRLITVADEAGRARAGAHFLVERLAAHFGPQELRGPARLPTMRGRARWHLLVTSRGGERMRNIVGQAVAQLTEPFRRRGVTLVVDVDPLSFG